jgi:hypothetical protein
MKEASTKHSKRAAVSVFTQPAAKALLAKMGVEDHEYGQVTDDISTWIGDAQSPSAFKLRIASAMLRGVDPSANTHMESSPERRAKVKQVCQNISPGYLKALLVHKAVTEAAAERHTNDAGTMPLVRGIGAKVSNGVLAQKKGDQARLREQSVSGYTPNLQTARDFAGEGGQIIFRHVRPHEMWHSQMFSPSHGGCDGEMENMIHHDNGGGWVPHVDNAAGVKPVGNMLSSQPTTTASTSVGKALRDFWGSEYLNFSKGAKAKTQTQTGASSASIQAMKEAAAKLTAIKKAHERIKQTRAA